MEKGIGLEELRQLISIVERNFIEELVVEEEGMEIVIKAEKPKPPPSPPDSPRREEAAPTSLAPVIAAPSPLPALPESLLPISAPLMGIFYRSPIPEDPPFVQEGDWVEVGQVVGTIEAMKIFNDIHSEISGRVVRILAGNEQLVTQGETLMLLESGPQEEGNHG